MTRYAENTSVSSDKSRAEIERTLARYGATSFMYGWDQGQAVVGFVAKGRQIRFHLGLPDRNSREFTHTPERRYARTAAQADAAYEQAVKQRWRALALVIKAKLEAVEAGITTFDDEFAMFTMLPDGSRARDHILPAITKAYETGKMVPMVPSMRAIEA